MTPVKQRIRHDPPNSYGDCHRAALASLLDLDIESVPHFMDGLANNEGAIFNKRQDDFLRSRGLDCIVFPVGGEIEEVFRAAGFWNPGKLFLLGGASDRGTGHTVIASPDGIVHDPHPSNIGVTSPMEDGYYWITYIVGLADIHNGQEAAR